MIKCKKVTGRAIRLETGHDKRKSFPCLHNFIARVIIQYILLCILKGIKYGTAIFPYAGKIKESFVLPIIRASDISNRLSKNIASSPLKSNNDIYFSMLGEAGLNKHTEDVLAIARKKLIFIIAAIITAVACLTTVLVALISGTEKDVRNILVGSVLFASVLLIAAGMMISSMYKNAYIPLKSIFSKAFRIRARGHDSTSIMPAQKDMKPVTLILDSIYNRLNSLISLIENVNRSHSFEDSLKYIYSSFKAYVPYEYIGIALIKDDGKTLEAAYGISDGTVKGLPDHLYGVKANIHDTSLAKVIQTGNARIINDLKEYTSGKRITDYNAIIMGAGICSSITLPLVIGDKPVGIIFFSSTHKNVYTEEHAVFLETVANSIAISFEKNIFVDDLLYSSILALAKLAEARDEDTGEHLERMKTYSREIASFLRNDDKFRDKITIEFVRNIERFSPMHDIGKVGVRDGILLKPGPLTEEEYEEMKKHTIYGADVLRAADENIARRGSNLFLPGIEIAENHHEKWDGTGYPHGKKREEIPLSARIVAVADVFDALTSKRPYKEAFSFEKAFEIIEEGSGAHFDPEIIRVLVKNKQRIRDIYESFSKNQD